MEWFDVIALIKDAIPVFASALGSAIGGAIAVQYLSKASLCIDDLYSQRFDKSVRLWLVVKNSSVAHAKNCVPYLTVTLCHDKECRKELPKVLMPFKKAFEERACKNDEQAQNKSKSWDYLVSECENAIIKMEALPWALPKEFGRGLDGDPYNHVADIPSKGFNRIPLMDIYRVEKEEGKWYVLRIFSEYGEVRLRAVLALPSQEVSFEKLVFDVYVACENTLKRGVAKIEIRREGNDYVVYFRNTRKFALDKITDGLREHGCAKATIKNLCR